MSRMSDLLFRAGYVVSLDAWERYLCEGHGIRYDADVANCGGSPEADDDDGEEEEEEEPMSEEDRQQLAKQQLSFDRVADYRGTFRGLSRRASPEVRTRLVLPHTFTRIIKDGELGTYQEANLFIPTSWSGASKRKEGPEDVDRTRIQAFIDEANGLIKDDARREAAGFKFQEPDFKFERFPDWAISRPLLSDTELKNLVHAGWDALRLWGISPREFLHPYTS